MRALVLVAVFVAAMTCPAAAAAENGSMLTVVGYLENAVLLPMGFSIQAKMDTGTTSTSINALNIRRYRKDGEDWVSFEVVAGDRSLKLRRRVERLARIRHELPAARRASLHVDRRASHRLGRDIREQAGLYRGTGGPMTIRESLLP